jgi:hypothetical protein
MTTTSYMVHGSWFIKKKEKREDESLAFDHAFLGGFDTSCARCQ